jgi:group I intron endonuclease
MDNTTKRSVKPFSQHSKINYLYKWGVYKIENKITGDFYIGSTIDLSKRFSDHKYYMRKGTHHNPKLQKDYNTYGEDSFVFSTLIFCDVCNLELYEKVFISALNPTYNIQLVGNTAYVITLKKKESAELVASKSKHKGHKWTDAQREKYSATRTGMKIKGSSSPKNLSEEGRKRRSEIAKAIWERRRNEQSAKTEGD